MHKLDHINAINQTALVEPHAKALESCANAMEAAGIGGDLTNGHVTVLRKMAADLRASGAHGKLPSVFHAAAEPAALLTHTRTIFANLGV
jgi:hypothetical protein